MAKDKRKKIVKDETPVETPEQVEIPKEESTPTSSVQETPVVDTDIKDETPKVEDEDKTPETTPKPVVPESSTTPKVTVNSIKTFDELTEFFKDNADVKHTLNSVVRYLEIGKNSTVDPKVDVGCKYDLYLSMKRVLEINDYNVFKKNFDIINKAFLIGAKGRFSPISLNKFDYHWNFGTDSKLSFQIISEVIATLANPVTRTENKKSITVSGMFKYLNDTGVQNITRYYSL